MNTPTATHTSPDGRGSFLDESYEAPALRVIGPVTEFTFGSMYSNNDNNVGTTTGPNVGGHH